MNDDFLNDLWTDNEEEPMDIDWSALHQDATTFRRTIRRRNLLEMFAAGAVVVFFASAAWRGDDPWMRASHVALALGALVIAWNLARRGEAPEPEPARSTADFLDARRAELTYQADLLDGVLVWYLGPLIPGFVLSSVGTFLGQGVVAGTVSTIIVAGMLAGIWWLNRKAAKGLREEASGLPVVG